MRMSPNASDIRLLMPVIYYYSPDLAATLYELARNMADIDSVSIHSARSESRLRLLRLHLPRLPLSRVQFPSLINRRGEARRAANSRRRASGSPRTRSRRFYRGLTTSQTDSAVVSRRWSTPCSIVLRGAVADPGQFLAGVPEG